MHSSPVTPRRSAFLGVAHIAPHRGHTRIASLALILGLLVAAPPGVADGPTPSGVDRALSHSEEERPRQPYLPGTGQRSGVRTLAPPTVAGIYTSIQANVDGAHLNITGDAANEPSLAVDPNAPNRLVIGWRQFDNVASDFRQAGWGWSADGGRTWTFPGTLEPEVFRSDPVLDTDADGNFYYMSLQQGLHMQLFKSTDGGESWGLPVEAFGGDKEWMAIDRTGGPGRGHIYTSWQHASPFAPNQFSRSIDGGASFQAPLPLPSRPFFGTMIVATDGAHYLCGIDDFAAGPHFRVLRSDDAQNPAVMPTFPVNTAIDMGGVYVLGAEAINPVGSLGQPWIVENPTNGHLYMLCSVDPPGEDPLDVRFVRSADRGVTWSASVRVNDDPADNEAWQWFGTMSVAPNGRIDAIWNDTRNAAANPDATTSQLFYSFSMDGGVTWAAGTAVSLPFAHRVGYPNQRKLGDYYQMVSDRLGAHVAYAATHNGEQDVWYLRIGDYDCNGNGVADPADIAGGTSLDCNLNGIPDECDIAARLSRDVNGNDVPDECETIATEMDIKPGDCPNPLNVASRGLLPVALVGTADVPAADVDLATLALGRADGAGGTVPAQIGPGAPSPQIVDVASVNPGTGCACNGGGTDGVDDLMLKFSTAELADVLELDAETPGAEVELRLTGQRLDGFPFEATDCILIVPPVIRPGHARRLDGSDADRAGAGFAVRARMDRSARPVAIRYRLPARAQVWADVHDLLGRRVRGLLDAAERAPGVYEVAWDGTDERGVRMGRGVYLVRVRARSEGGTSEERTVRAALLR